MSHSEPIEPLINQLPPELQREAIAYIKRLMNKSQKIGKRKLSLDWAGGLSYMKGTCSSTELQHRITEWWI